ncbi:MAG: ribose 5-phosphate isomerase B [Spiroplasma poulsonii]|uniref:Putative ribose-5-phosphate isomerase B n=1 Tax=Spiroplasma poulsonii TaxID=2138 RepID=A0A2P6FFM8_9MOLU|nr:ribose 5-phosphate isomerase B [Spiroplasma poulsonii]KAF0850090.1 putative ribose-5-phosphate isomerase B [Spiroplasma poulsonii]MBW1242047.1 ribose 5-phosphate isomerase B [Spiroplasma poulsonii]PQM32267.1 putative ribose-5-phosphate isomerase B [Spiroplasma poulsonii]PWF94920.1 putative ribose-5-phosphate isomerase B [Spiroplasma poulsonii]PWF97715.1 putative ribose-5-phosphate isomerase B [Spiroplasma poulsonii]
MKVIIGNDHTGVEMKNAIVKYLTDQKHQVINLGTNSDAAVDYPDLGQEVGEKVMQEKDSLGIVICGTGIGISIAANKVKGVRAALCNETNLAKLAREHNNANVLALGARVIAIQNAIWIVETFLNTSFDAGRHALRIDKLNKL